MAGLPCNVDAERFVLGSLFLDETHWPSVAGILAADDFSLEKHRRIYKRIAGIHESGGSISRFTTATARA